MYSSNIFEGHIVYIKKNPHLQTPRTLNLESIIKIKRNQYPQIASINASNKVI